MTDEATPLETLDEELEDFIGELRREVGIIKRLKWINLAVIFVVFVIVLALEIQVQQRNHDIRVVRASVEKLQDSADETKRAAESAENVLKAAIAQNQNSAINQQAVIKAFQQIADADAKLDSIIKQLGLQQP